MPAAPYISTCMQCSNVLAPNKGKPPKYCSKECRIQSRINKGVEQKAPSKPEKVPIFWSHNTSGLWKTCTGSCGRVLPATSEFFAPRMFKCRDCTRGRPKLPKIVESAEEKAEKIRAYSKAVWQRTKNDPEAMQKLRERGRASRQKPKNRKRVQEHHRKYYQRPEVRLRCRVNNATRVARKKAVAGTYTDGQILELLNRQKYACYYCFAPFQEVQGKRVYQVDHTFPLSRVAGTDIPANDITYLVLACPACNLSKNNRFPWEWPEGGRLL